MTWIIRVNASSLTGEVVNYCVRIIFDSACTQSESYQSKHTEENVVEEDDKEFLFCTTELE